MSKTHKTCRACGISKPIYRFSSTICFACSQKAYEESKKGSLIVCLVPSRTDTRWFHDYAIKGEIRFVKGRLKFGGAKNPAPFPSMIVIFGGEKWKTLS